MDSSFELLVVVAVVVDHHDVVAVVLLEEASLLVVGLGVPVDEVCDEEVLVLPLVAYCTF